MSSASEAFIKLVELADRSRLNARELPYKSEVETSWRGIGFSLGGAKFIVAMGEITEILAVPRFTQVPGVCDWVMGVANVRGRLLLISDLMSFLSQASTLQLRQRRLLVVEKDDLYSGLVIDEVLGMQHFPVAGFSDEVDQLDPAFAPYVTGVFQSDEGEPWFIFSMSKLAEDPRFMRAAS